MEGSAALANAFAANLDVNLLVVDFLALHHVNVAQIEAVQKLAASETHVPSVVLVPHNHHFHAVFLLTLTDLFLIVVPLLIFLYFSSQPFWLLSPHAESLPAAPARTCRTRGDRDGSEAAKARGLRLGVAAGAHILPPEPVCCSREMA